MNFKKVSINLIYLIFWSILFFISMRYIGAQWEYEGLLTQGLIVGISLVSTKHILYSIATIVASAFIAATIVMFIALFWGFKNNQHRKRLRIFSITALAIIVVAFIWNRRNIAKDKLPIAYRYYDSTGKLLEPGNVVKNLKDVNILLISIDTLNPKHLGIYGYGRNTSPTIDSLANEGVLFLNAFSHSPKTSPSHMSLFTSLYPSVHKIRNWNKYQGGYSLDHHIITLPEILKNVGYKTAAFTGGGNVQSSIGFGDGFDSYNNDDQVWEGALEWLDHNHKSKFFLFLHTFKVHSPYLPQPPYNTLFDSNYQGKIIDSENGLKAYFRNNSTPGEDYPGSHHLFWGLVDKQSKLDVEHLVALYDGCIRFMNDKMMAALVNKLKKYNLVKNTLIIFISDHGEEFLQHGDFLHKELFDEHVHVPLIMHLPEYLKSKMRQKIVRNQVSLIDIVPTILNVLSLPTPVMAQGSNLMPLVEGEEIDLPVFSERIVISDVPDKKKAIRTLDWKYIWWPTKQNRELYDLKNDPGEQINVAKKHPQVVADLHKQVLEWINANEKLGHSFKTFTHTFNKETLEKLKSLGYIR